MSRRQKDLFPEFADGKKYISDIPELLAEWHPTKNKEKLPEDISYGAGVSIWWRCAEGHEWTASANTRTNLKAGCPKCAAIRVGKMHSKATVDYNLQVINPNLCKEWHPKNKKLPSEYLPKSSKKVWWQCKIDPQHEWQAQIASRTNLQGETIIGCPFCSGKRASRGYNLATERPELLSEWCIAKNRIEPTELTPNSHTKVWWECEKGHLWHASPHNRRQGRGCPKCTHQTSKGEIRILTELMFVYEKVLSRYKIDGYELDIYLPDLNVGIEYDGAFWHSNKVNSDTEKQSHIESLGIRLLRVREKPLPKISDDDQLINPRVELEKVVIDRLVKLIGGNKVKLAEYTLSKKFKNQKLFNTYLSYFPSPFPEKSLSVLNPELAEQWHPTKNMPLTPSNFTLNSGHKVWWQCEFGHEWKTTIDSRNSKSGGTGCPYCSPTFKLASSTNNLAISNPELLEFFHPSKNGGLKPQDITHGSEKPIWWKCPKEPSHVFFRSPNHMTSSKAQELCPYCNGFFVSKLNSMETTHPELAKLFHPHLNGKLTPQNTRAGTKETLWWRCENGHEWQATGSAMYRRAFLCKLCKPN